MKKFFIVFTILTMMLLFVLTPSMYVEGIEIPVIITGTAILALLLQFPEDKKEKLLANGMRVFAGFAFGWIFSVFDLVIDHILYFQPSGFEDGAYLTLGIKFDEFSNSFFLLSLFCMAAVAFYVVIQMFIMFVRGPKSSLH